MKKSKFIEAALIMRGEYSKSEIEDLLDVFQQLGMVPPPYQTTIYNRADCDFYYVNEWETEDEEKDS